MVDNLVANAKITSGYFCMENDQKSHRVRMLKLESDAIMKYVRNSVSKSGGGGSDMGSDRLRRKPPCRAPSRGGALVGV